jgi:KTSC domain
MNPAPSTALPVPIDSTVLTSAQYDATRSTLRLEFRSGAVYLYFNVPVSIYDGLLAADSKGSFFSRQIRSVFPNHRGSA